MQIFLFFVLFASLIDLYSVNSLPTTPKRCEISPFAQSSLESEAKLRLGARSDEPERESRCFQTLLGWFTESQLESIGDIGDYNGPSGIPDLSTSPNLQGGVLAGPTPTQNKYIYSSQSHNAPGGLPPNAMDAVKNAQLMNDQLQAMSGQFSGIQGSGIPLSPTNFRQSVFRTGLQQTELPSVYNIRQ